MQVDLKSFITCVWSFAAGALVALSIQWQDKPKVEVVCVPPSALSPALAAQLAVDATQLAADPSAVTGGTHD